MVELHNKSVLVTGGSGFIGEEVVKLLLQEGAKVYITTIDKILPPLQQNLHIIECDITDPNLKLPKVDLVIHLAGIMMFSKITKDAEDSIKMLYKVNTFGTQNVLNALLEHPPLSFLLMSSASVYGNQEIIPVNEDAELHPINDYGKSKLQAEEFCLSFCNEHNITLHVVRPFNVYGVKQTGGIIASMLSNARTKGVIGVTSASRDLIHVKDTAKAIVAISKNKGGAYNLGSGEEVFMKDLAEIIINEMSQRGKSVSVASIENTIGSIIRSAADITKLKSIGWHPQIDLLEGIAELINKN